MTNIRIYIKFVSENGSWQTDLCVCENIIILLNAKAELMSNLGRMAEFQFLRGNVLFTVKLYIKIYEFTFTWCVMSDKGSVCVALQLTPLFTIMLFTWKVSRFNIQYQSFK